MTKYYIAEGFKKWQACEATTLLEAQELARLRQKEFGSRLSVGAKGFGGYVKKIAYTYCGEWVACN